MATEGWWSMVNGRWSLGALGRERPSTIDYRPLFILGCCLVLSGCANVVNYTDPAGPRFAGASAPAASPTTLRIVTFNIRYAQQIDSALAVLQSDPALRGADVIALQEMDEDGVRRIADALGMNYIYYPAVLHPLYGKDFGNALLARWPIEADRKIILPHLSLSRRAQRVAVTGSVMIGQERVQLYAVHLANPLEVGYGGQKDQLRAVLSDADSVSGPVVIAGDFNSYEVAGEALAHGFTWPTSRVGGTHHGFDIDHVLVRGLGDGSGSRAGVVRDIRGASDHHPVWAVVPMD